MTRLKPIGKAYIYAIGKKNTSVICLERKTVILVTVLLIIAVCVGLGGGYYWGIATQQPELFRLEKDLANAQADLQEAQTALAETQTELKEISAEYEAYKLTPPEPSSVTLNSLTTALVIIDMQNDYCKKNGSFYAPESEAVITSISALLAEARAKGMPIVYTQNWLSDPDGGWAYAYEMGWTVIPPHCLENTWGAEIVDELKPTAEDYVIRKFSFSMFLGVYRQGAEEIMAKFAEEHPDVDTFIITGTVTNVCVFFNSDVLYWLGYKVVLPVDCAGGSAVFRSEKGDVGYDYTLWFLSTCDGVMITTTELITLV